MSTTVVGAAISHPHTIKGGFFMFEATKLNVTKIIEGKEAATAMAADGYTIKEITAPKDTPPKKGGNK